MFPNRNLVHHSVPGSHCVPLSKHLGPPPPPPKCLDLRDSVRPSSMSGGASPSCIYLSKLLQVFVKVVTGICHCSYMYLSMLSDVIIFVFVLTLECLPFFFVRRSPVQLSAVHLGEKSREISTDNSILKRRAAVQRDFN